MYVVHPISQPISKFIKQSNFLSIYPMVGVFVCICKLSLWCQAQWWCYLSPMFCFIDDYPASEISKHIYHVTSKRQKCADIAFIDRNKDHRLTTGWGQFHAHLRVWVMLIVEDHIVIAKSRKIDKVLHISFIWICV